MKHANLTHDCLPDPPTPIIIPDDLLVITVLAILTICINAYSNNTKSIFLFFGSELNLSNYLYVLVFNRSYPIEGSYLNGAGCISPVSGSSNSSLRNSTNIVFFDSSKSLKYLAVISFNYCDYFLKSSSSINLSEITLLDSFLHIYTITSLGFNPTFFNEFLISSLSILKHPNIILLISFIVKL